MVKCRLFAVTRWLLAVAGAGCTLRPRTSADSIRSGVCQRQDFSTSAKQDIGLAVERSINHRTLIR